MATNNFVTVPAQSKNLDTNTVTTTQGLVHRQVVNLGDPTSATGYVGVTGGALNVYSPTGATEATLSSLNSKFTLGQQTMANSVSVVLASNQTAIATTSENAIVVSNSSTSTPLNASATFTGTSTDLLNYGDVTIACLTDQDGVLYAEFSNDGTNWDSSLSYSVKANVNEPHRLTRTRRYFRARFTNTSTNNQSFLRLQCIAGQMNLTTSRLNSEVQTDADTVVVRPMDFNLMVTNNLYQNHLVTIKDGINATINTGTVPEDVTNEGGVYAGFPATAAAAEIVVSGGDTGTVWYSYLASDTDTEYTFASKAITGIGTYSLGHNIWRCNYAYYVANSGTSPNVGAITIRQSAPNTSVVFCVIDANIGQSFCAAYTVPYQNSIYLDRISGGVRGSTSGSLEGYFYYKPYNQSAYFRFPFELQFGSLYFDDIDYLIKIPERTDLIPRITASSVNGLSAKVSYRFVKVKA